MKINVFTLILSLFYLIGSAENSDDKDKCVIKGKVTSSSLQIEYLNIMVLSANDSSYIAGGFCNSTKFQVDDVVGSQFLVYLSSLSYDTKKIFVQRKKNQNVIDLGVISLQQKELDEIKVISRVPIIEQSSGKISIQVAGSSLSQAGNGVDVLKNSPRIMVDKDNEITVLGKGVAKVYVDGRLISDKTELDDITSEEISKVEIITNPSAKYDASSNAVVNIQTKKHFREGYNFNHTSSIRKGEYGQYNGNMNLSINKDNFEIYTFLSLKKGKQKYNDTYYRDITTDTYEILIDNDLYKVKDIDYPVSYKMGVNYNIDKNSLIRVLYNGSDYESNSYTYNQTDLMYNDEASLYQTYTDNNLNSNRHSVSASFNNSIDSLNRKISGQVDYMKYNSHDSDLINEYITSDGYYEYLKKDVNSQDIQILSGTIDYTNKNDILDVDISTGLKYTDVTSNSSNTYSQYYDDIWNVDDSNSILADYREKIYAYYLMLNKDIGKIHLKGSIRLEHSDSEGIYESTYSSETKSSSTYLFPSFSCSYNFKTDFNASLIYSKRIERPSFSDLNPFCTYIDSLSYYKGNPDLIPAITHSCELSVDYKKMASISFNYMYTKDPMFMYVETDSEYDYIVYVSMNNFDKLETYSTTLTIPYQLKFWTTYNSLGVNFNRVGYQSSENIEINQEKATFFAYSHHSFKLPKRVSIFSTYKYYSSGINGLFEYKSKHILSIGASKKFKNNLSVQINYNDIFNTDKNITNASINQINLEYNSRYDASYIQLSLKYNLGGDISQNKAKSRLENELKRIK
jgi:hypothetical protein